MRCPFPTTNESRTLSERAPELPWPDDWKVRRAGMELTLETSRTADRVVAAVMLFGIVPAALIAAGSFLAKRRRRWTSSLARCSRRSRWPC